MKKNNIRHALYITDMSCTATNPDRIDAGANTDNFLPTDPSNNIWNGTVIGKMIADRSRIPEVMIGSSTFYLENIIFFMLPQKRHGI